MSHFGISGDFFYESDNSGFRRISARGGYVDGADPSFVWKPAHHSQTAAETAEIWSCFVKTKIDTGFVQYVKLNSTVGSRY